MTFNSANYAFRVIKNVGTEHIGAVLGSFPSVSPDEAKGSGFVESPQPTSQAPLTSAIAAQAISAMPTAQDRESLSGAASQQQAMFCGTFAPALKGQSAEALKTIMRNLGYADNMYDTLVKTLEKCP